MKAVEPEVIFKGETRNSEIPGDRSTLYTVGFGLKILLTAIIGTFVALVIMICFPISALCTLGTILTTSTRLAVTHLIGRFKSQPPR